MSGELKKSPLDEVHRELGGRMVPFAGWEMPVMYDSIIREHRAVREKAGIFDISHMGQLFIGGKGAEAWLDSLLTNSVAALEDGRAQYTLMLNEKAGVIDDLIIYRLKVNSYLLIVNASKIHEDSSWLQGKLPKKNVTLRDESPLWAGLAVQGPDACEAYTAATGGRTLPARNGIDDLVHQRERLIVCRTGYTGEDGFELFCAAENGPGWFKRFVKAGATPCGLGARDTLRLEMAYPLNGNDLTPDHTPLEAGLGFFVDLDKGDFTGSDILKDQKENGPKTRLFAIELTEKGAPPRPGYPVLYANGETIGTLTSGCLSPTLGTGIGLAYLPAAVCKIGTPVKIQIRGRDFPARIVKKPFLKKP